MPHYSYMANTTFGTAQEGTLEAADEAQLKIRLRKMGLFLVSCTALAEAPDVPPLDNGQTAAVADSTDRYVTYFWNFLQLALVVASVPLILLGNLVMWLTRRLCKNLPQKPAAMP